MRRARAGTLAGSSLNASPDRWERRLIEQGSLYDTDEPSNTIWRADASCRDQQTSLWFGETAEDERAAKAVCWSCPVRERCLETHLTEPAGVFGGLNELERRNRYRRQMRRAASRVA